MNIYAHIKDSKVVEKQILDKQDFQEISSLINSFKYDEVLEKSEDLILHNIFDIRIIVYMLFCCLNATSTSNYSSEFSCFCNMLETDHEKLSPNKFFNKHLKNSLIWLHKLLLTTLKYKIQKRQIEEFAQDELLNTFYSYKKVLMDNFEIDSDGDIRKLIDTLVPFKKGLQKETINNTDDGKTEKDILKVDSDDGKAEKESQKADSGKTVGIKESSHWKELKKKIYIFRTLMEGKRYLEAAFFFADINNKIRNFDPRKYFPEEFFPLYEVMTKDFEKVLSIIDTKQNTLQWHIVEQMYNVDPEALVTGKEPYNTSIPDSFTEVSAYLKNTKMLFNRSGLIQESYCNYTSDENNNNEQCFSPVNDNNDDNNVSSDLDNQNDKSEEKYDYDDDVSDRY
ncbi:MAG: hypothetical protein GY756_00970 [bacterium]|nr:hypothetical protein [bacterium]